MNRADLAKDPEERRSVVGDAEYQSVAEEMRGRLLDVVLATERKGPEQISHA